MSGAEKSPMFVQYHDLRARVPGAVLFFRMGDFYEVFFDDAVLCARVLELTLTSRNKNDEVPIPMAGVPYHAANGYIQRLVDAGHRVAIAEQVEDPSAAKGLVRREIVRVVTPGVALDPTTLDARLPNRIVAIAVDKRRYGLAFLDASTGDLQVTSVDTAAQVVAEALRLEPREAVVEGDGADLASGLRRGGVVLSAVEAEAWDLREAQRELRSVLGVQDLGGFGVDPKDAAVRAAGAVVRYARDQSGGSLKNLHRLRVYRASGHLVLDEATRRNLELVRTLIGGSRKGSLLGLIDQCQTAIGSRLMRDWLAFPLLDRDVIDARQAAVAALVDDAAARESLSTSLRSIADIERLDARVSQGTASPRELGALRRSLAAVPQVLAPVAHLAPIATLLPEDTCADVLADLDRWLVDEPPLTLDEGGVIRREIDPSLDRATDLAVDGVGHIGRLEERERDATGISSLKIRRNNVFGWFIEITRAHVHRVPDRFVRRQTLSTGERYITAELKELEEAVIDADRTRLALEASHFAALRDRVAEASARVQVLAHTLARLDVLCGLAEVATRCRWVRPMLDESSVLELVAARHPVVEASLEEERFVPNDVRFDVDGDRLVVLTGPNMAGKSTVLRQVALIVLLAQMGSHVPADSARIGICDRIFTRVGAADDLARGQSTFMVEMAETAAILHGATDRSLVVLDEIGRGTSTYDGLSIAWAVAEDLVRIGCRAMFATHYHELCDLAEQRDGVRNQSVAVHESGDRIVFLRKLKDGGASRSYGIQCARIAGLPNPVVERARELLKRFERSAPRNERQQLSLFGAVPTEVRAEPAPIPALEALRALDPDALTPRQALDELYRLHRML